MLVKARFSGLGRLLHYGPRLAFSRFVGTTIPVPQGGASGGRMATESQSADQIPPVNRFLPLAAHGWAAHGRAFTVRKNFS